MDDGVRTSSTRCGRRSSWRRATALVKELKADGRKDDAAAVAKLRRPSVAAWALNQVAREQPDLVEAAIDAGEQLRAASDAAVAGRPGELRAATAAERTAANAVVKAAAAHLGAAGRRHRAGAARHASASPPSTRRSPTSSAAACSSPSRSSPASASGWTSTGPR